MGRLIKPKNMDIILSEGIVLHSRKQYINVINSDWAYITVGATLNDLCAVRKKSNVKLPVTIPFENLKVHCDDIAHCCNCFLKANNYLNILKYIKHHGQK